MNTRYARGVLEALQGSSQRAFAKRTYSSHGSIYISFCVLFCSAVPFPQNLHSERILISSAQVRLNLHLLPKVWHQEAAQASTS